MRLQATPGQDPMFDLQDDEVAQEPEQADRRHVGDHDIHPSDVIGVPQHVTEAGLDRHHLGDDHRGPADAEADPQAGKNRRQRRRQHDAAQHRPAPCPHHQRGADQVAFDVAGALRGVEYDGKEGAERNQEDRADILDAEYGDGKRKPRRDRYRPQQLDGGIERAGGQPIPADRNADGNADQDGAQKTLADPFGRKQHIGKPGAAIGIEPETGRPKRPDAPGFPDPVRRRQYPAEQRAAAAGDLPNDNHRQRQNDCQSCPPHAASGDQRNACPGRDRVALAVGVRAYALGRTRHLVMLPPLDQRPTYFAIALVTKDSSQCASISPDTSFWITPRSANALAWRLIWSGETTSPSLMTLAASAAMFGAIPESWA